MDTWVDSSKCAWSGPIWLRKIPLLEDNYLGLSSFFCNTLGIRKATWRTILSEATCIQPSDDLAYISRIFRALDTYVEEADSTGKQEIIASTSHAYIFPIDAGQSGLGFDYMSSVRDVNIWFIADRVHLKESFHGLVPLLAIKADLVENIPHLLKALDLRDRLLTEAAGSDVQTQGTEKVHTTFTAQFRAKVPFIAR